MSTPTKQHRTAILQRDPLRREPQITLRCVARFPDQSIGRIQRSVFRAQPAHVVAGVPLERVMTLRPYGRKGLALEGALHDEW